MNTSTPCAVSAWFAVASVGESKGRGGVVGDFKLASASVTPIWSVTAPAIP